MSADQIRERARQMARSGRFGGWRLIAIELRFIEGIRAAGDCFADRPIRDELDMLCREAQRQLARRLRPLLRPMPAPQRGAADAHPPRAEDPADGHPLPPREALMPRPAPVQPFAPRPLRPRGASIAGTTGLGTPKYRP